MKVIENDYSENMVCPFCNKILIDKENIDQFKTCEHTIFVATDEGFEYIREDMKAIIDKHPDDNYDKYTSELPIEGIKIADYIPAPSFFGSYFGFKE